MKAGEKSDRDLEADWDRTVGARPRKRGIRQSQIIAVTKILMMIVALVAIIVLRKECGAGVSNLFNTFAPPAADAGTAR